MSKEDRYSQRGVSADKNEVHHAIRHLDMGLFKHCFCKVLPDLVANDPEYCNIMHADTAGTKTSLAYVYWRETGDLNVWKGIAQDALVMNLDDMACVGSYQNIVVSSTIGRNKNLIPAEVLEALISGTAHFLEEMNTMGITIKLAGGETADVGDIVRTIDVGITAFGRLRRDQVITCKIKPGDVIIGLASFGQSSYETVYNAGMGSNGLTSARHDILYKSYAKKYPESFDPAVPDDLVYCGTRSITESIDIPGYGKRSIGELILSPTRTYIPVVKQMIEHYRSQITGLIHCTGGAQTKVLKFVDQLRIVKDNLFTIPPLFDLIEKESGSSRKEMYQVFNMGHRMEIYCDPSVASQLIDISRAFQIDARLIGRVEASDQKELIIRDDKGEYKYS